MPRKARRHQVERSLLFHVVNRGILKQDIFHGEEDFSAFLSAIRRYVSRAGIRVCHWCLMSNHYHIVMEIPIAEQLSKVVGGWQQVYAIGYHRRHNTAGRLFQGRFKSQAIEKERYLLACGRYVEQNPVRAGLYKDPCDWQWSSARFYVQGTNDDLTIQDLLWKDTDGETYRKWLDMVTEEETALFAGNDDAIGGEKFRTGVKRVSGRRVHQVKGRPVLGK